MMSFCDSKRRPHFLIKYNIFCVTSGASLVFSNPKRELRKSFEEIAVCKGILHSTIAKSKRSRQTSCVSRFKLLILVFMVLANSLDLILFSNYSSGFVLIAEIKSRHSFPVVFLPFFKISLSKSVVFDICSIIFL